MSETLAARAGLTLLQQIFALSDSSAESEAIKDACFVSIDCEAFERNHENITEIGISMLDTRHLVGVEAGSNATNWIAKMQYAHFRVLEYAKQVNRRFVKGREQYFNFGKTTWIHLADAKVVLDRLFKSPTRFSDIADFSVKLDEEERPVILVGHDLKNDTKYLEKLGFSVDDAQNIIKHMDTDTVAGGMRGRQLALRKLLVSLDIEASNLHNAGNDAAYTLQALISCAVKDHVERGSVFRDITYPSGKTSEASDGNGKADNIAGGTVLQQMIPNFLKQSKPQATIANVATFTMVPVSKGAPRKSKQNKGKRRDQGQAEDSQGPAT